MSCPALARQHRHGGRVEHRPAARQLDHAAVVGAVDDRLDARAGHLGRGVDVREQPDHRSVAGQGREHEAAVVHVRVVEPDLLQLVDQQPAEVELPRRARLRARLGRRLGVDAHVALEPVQQVRRQPLRKRRRVAHFASEPAISAAISATSVGVRPTRTPRASSASCLAAAVPAVPETIAPAWPIVLPGGAVKPAM